MFLVLCQFFVGRLNIASTGCIVSLVRLPWDNDRKAECGSS